MLRVVAHKSAAAAHKYYAEGLRREDYYSEKQEVPGKWQGMASELLGLSGAVTPETFAALVENRHPGTGERLTARTKGERVVGHDFNFHAPKSLSVLHAFTKDDKILTAFRDAVSETMQEFESLAETRVRKKGAQENRRTGNLAWAEFIHFTARPVAGIPDPHLHSHCFVMNATHDAAEGRWKAVKFRNLKAEAPYFEAVFHSRLAGKVVELGYGVERTRLGWDIAGIPREVIEKFSRRTAEIDRMAAEKGITDPKQKDALGAASREGKRYGMTMKELGAAWEARLRPEERELIKNVHQGRGQAEPPKTITPEQAFDEAAEKLFARSSVVPVNRLIGEALRFGVGQIAPEAAWGEFQRREMIQREVDGQQVCTSSEILNEELALIDFARSRRGRSAPLAEAKHRFGNKQLSAEQRNAVRHLLENRDQVMALRGAAGVGKTTLMKEAVTAIEASGLKVFAFAPSASASRETLREAGFAGAETVAHLLANRKLQKSTEGQVIWIDEAGLLGIRDMSEIMRIAGTDTRVILTGDTAQHSPVARGDAFRLMQKYAGLEVAEVKQIRRQEGAEYRKAVASLSEGDLATAFVHLEALGAIREIEDDGKRYRQLASDFVALARQGPAPLVVSPTHAEAGEVTAAIRAAKAEAGLLGRGREFAKFHNFQWEEPDRRRAENYQPGMVVQFHQNARGFKRGEVVTITGRDEGGRVVASTAKDKPVVLPLDQAGRFQVFEKRAIELCPGERVRITRNGKTEDGRRISNGNVFTIEKFDRKGNIVLTTGAVLNARQLHIDYGYCQTSHSSQSKSIEHVLVAQSADSFLAASREQFYVSVSRGKQSLSIYTDNRTLLQEAVGNSSLRSSGLEFAGYAPHHMSEVLDKWRSQIKSRREDGAKTHEEVLMAERKIAGRVKPEGMGFEDYIKMQRANAGADGKAKSKGNYAKPTAKTGNIADRFRAHLRPTQQPTAPRTPGVGATATKQSRVANGLAAGKERLQRAVAKIKGGVQAAKERGSRLLPKSNPQRAASQLLKKQRTAKKQKTAEQTKVAKKTPAPTMRRGR